MSQRGPSDKVTPAPSAAPATGDTGDGHSGSGAQTALQAMLKKRRMRATRDPDPASPSEDATEDPRE
jgi:hypothetical protein